jgi:hypothetical protein
MDITAAWHWPQWALAIILFMRLSLGAGMHGRAKVIASGPDKGEPEKYSFFSTLTTALLWAFILICGGFFA